MEKINKLIMGTLAKKGLAGPAQSAQICFYATEWPVAQITPISFSKGLLKVSVSSSSESSELQMKESLLIDFINQKMGKNVVRRLRILNMR